MKEYVTFDISYWHRISKDLPPMIMGKKSSDISLDNKLEDRSLAIPSLDKPVDGNDSAKGNFLEEIIGERLNFLSSSISQLEFLHYERIRVSNKIKLRIEYSIMYYKYLIYELDLWPRGYNSVIEKRRIHLERIRNLLGQEKRKEITACWSDILNVTRDLRIVLKEYIELHIRKRIVQK